MAPDTQPKMGPNGRPVRPFIMPASFSGKLQVWHLLLLRRSVQLGILLLFLGTVRWGWEVAGRPVLTGNLSSSELFGLIPLADPFATLQILLTGQLPLQEVLLGAAIILIAYTLLGGRTWCSWACPVNMVTDLSAWLRRRLGISDLFRINRRTRHTAMEVALFLSVLTGVAAFEWVSPSSMLHRELIYGIGLGWTAVFGVFLLSSAVQGWFMGGRTVWWLRIAIGIFALFMIEGGILTDLIGVGGDVAVWAIQKFIRPDPNTPFEVKGAD